MNHCPIKYSGNFKTSNLFLLYLLTIRIQSETANKIIPAKNNSTDGLKVINASSQDCQIKHANKRLYTITGNFNLRERIGWTVIIKYIHIHKIGINL